MYIIINNILMLSLNSVHVSGMYNGTVPVAIKMLKTERSDQKMTKEEFIEEANVSLAQLINTNKINIFMIHNIFYNTTIQSAASTSRALFIFNLTFYFTVIIKYTCSSAVRPVPDSIFSPNYFCPHSASSKGIYLGYIASHG